MPFKSKWNLISGEFKKKKNEKIISDNIDESPILDCVYTKPIDLIWRVAF